MAETTSDRILFALKTGGAQTAQALAQLLGITSVAVRQHLGGLTETGLVDHEDERRSVGRPKRHWRLTEKGHARFPDNHAHLTLDLIGAVTRVFGADGLDRLIAEREAEGLARYRRELADISPLGERLGRLAALRSEEGYMAESRGEADGSFTFIENHCPICAAARACQGFCRSELAIFRAVLPECAVERVDHLLAGARRCAYRVTPI